MVQQSVFVREGPINKAPTVSPELRGWTLLLPAGLLFFLVGSLDIGLAWLPLGLGRPEWEFATVTATFNGLPGPTMGLALLAASAVATGRMTLAKILSVLFFLIALLILASTAVYATNIPVAFDAVPTASPARAGLDKAIAKTLVQAVLYFTVLIWLGVATWRRAQKTPEITRT